MLGIWNIILICVSVVITSADTVKCKPGQFSCTSGQCVPGQKSCDGVFHCDDGSDETMDTCTNSRRSLLSIALHCSGGRRRVGVCPPTCALLPHLCAYALAAHTGAPGTCILPTFPEHGSYSTTNVSSMSPTTGFADFSLNFTCEEGWKVEGSNLPRCEGGQWRGSFPKCVIDVCALPTHKSVTYQCQSPQSPGLRQCRLLEPGGTTALAVCREGYYLGPAGDPMTCRRGEWSRIKTCSVDCGLPSLAGPAAAGRPAALGEAPWHATVYSALTTPRRHVCAGTIVTRTFIISVAHCYWDQQEGRLRNATSFAVTAGNLYRVWGHSYDNVLSRDVSEIIIPPSYKDDEGHYFDDIALVRVAEELVFSMSIKPMCLDWELPSNGSIGRVATWGLTDETLHSEGPLRVSELRLLPPGRCRRRAEHSFEEYLDEHKFCAVYASGTRMYNGDSGTGFSVKIATGVARGRYRLVGVASIAPHGDHNDDDTYFIMFTNITDYRQFIIDNISELRDEEVAP